jgi:uncharacterized membrane protein YdjX (TVP38/TMEM64 family)
LSDHGGSLPRRRAVRKRWLILLAISIALALISPAFRLSMFADWIPLHRIIAWVNLARSNRPLALSFYLVYAVGVMLLPITMFPIIGGVLFPFWIALPLNIAAATAGAWLSFRVGRAFGRVAIEPLMRRNLKALDRLAASRGVRTVFLLRLIGVPPFIVTNYGLGLSGVRNSDFLVGTAAGIVPWMALVTSLSTSLWNAVLVGGEKGMMRALVKALAPLTAVSALVLTSVVVAWYVRRHRARSAIRTYNQSPLS